MQWSRTRLYGFRRQPVRLRAPGFRKIHVGTTDVKPTLRDGKPFPGVIPKSRAFTSGMRDLPQHGSRRRARPGCRVAPPFSRFLREGGHRTAHVRSVPDHKCQPDPYSIRSDTSGSTRAARQAGTRQAAIEISMRSTAEQIRVTGSHGSNSEKHAPGNQVVCQRISGSIPAHAVFLDEISILGFTSGVVPCQKSQAKECSYVNLGPAAGRCRQSHN